MARPISKGMNKKTNTLDEQGFDTAAVSGRQAERSPESHQSQDWEPVSRGSIKGVLVDEQGTLHRRIAERAFLLYEESGFRHGNDLEHWLEAERQVKTLGV